MDTNIGRPKLRRSDDIRLYMKEKQVKIEEAQDRRSWRLKTRCADPKLGKERRRKSVNRNDQGYQLV